MCMDLDGLTCLSHSHRCSSNQVPTGWSIQFMEKTKLHQKILKTLVFIQEGYGSYSCLEGEKKAVRTLGDSYPLIFLFRIFILNYM